VAHGRQPIPIFNPGMSPLGGAPTGPPSASFYIFSADRFDIICLFQNMKYQKIYLAL
jgi:hypothetical protein